ncbi:Dam family site-specific DNA-(adenine-N6)-methyltransferase [Ochrobactrum sp. Q0168]|uniref:DNA adenine methylase n=1 Tax=Ochrobactrum sp. Q0168 TaxID=2793241 RepID=UPI0018EE3B98|nr:Dam family site-specific DNA-(adenine-N6)-methyltransferase [Ochrobactrum sp. Q0168]
MLPFLKWAGGKRWLFNDNFIKTLPKFERYIEPFLGGGAGFFALEPNAALISDVNSELINLYENVRDNPAGIIQLLQDHQANHSKDYYYYIRQQVPVSSLESAARMLYLNRTCWNGLYRLNQRGEFNVPIGSKTAVLLPSDDFFRASSILKQAEIIQGDFEKVLSRAGSGDLVFIDPPYTVAHNMNGFVKYNEKIFTWSDQIRLKKSIESAAARGASIILSNANHISVAELYGDLGTKSEVSRHSVISGSSAFRGTTTELIVRV